MGVAETPDGGGYPMVGSYGGVLYFGDATFFGSMGGRPVNRPIANIVTTHDGRGYIEIASDGGIFNFADAGFAGSLPGLGVHVSDIVGGAARRRTSPERSFLAGPDEDSAYERDLARSYETVPEI